MGGVSNPVPLPIGSGVGQIPEPQPPSANLFGNTARPGALTWAAAGACAFAQFLQDQFDAGFVPIGISGTIAADTLTNAQYGVTTAGQTYTISAELSGDTDFAAVNNAPSPSVRLRVDWLTFPGLVLVRTDSIVVNPITGAALSQSAGVVAAQSEPFAATLPNGALGACYKFAFQAIAPVTSGACRLVITPCEFPTVQTTKNVMAGAFQLENRTRATSYIGTTASLDRTQAILQSTRAIGTAPRQATDRSRPLRNPDNNGIFNYEFGTDHGKAFIAITPGTVITVPLGPIGVSSPVPYYEWFTVMNYAGGNITINGTGGNGFFGPGFGSVNSFVLPSVLGGAPLTNVTTVTILLAVNPANGIVTGYIVESNIGPFDATGAPLSPPVPAVPAAGKILRSTGAAWAASTATFPDTVAGAGILLRATGANVWAQSQTSYPDLIASGNVLHATAANTIGSANAFTYASGRLQNTTQPAFLATQSATVTDKTGAGATYTVLFDNEIFDQAANYNPATGQFTAPSTGRYFFVTNIRFTDLTVAMTTYQQAITTSNRGYSITDVFGANPYTQHSCPITCFADMDAGDTAQVDAFITGGAGNTADIVGTNVNTSFAGYLVC